MSTSRHFLIAITVAAGAGLLTFHFANAHSGATGVVKERMEMMKSMGNSMKELAAMVRGKQEYDAGRVRAIAASMQGHAKMIPAMFPKGSNKMPSEAKETIWSDPAGFASSAKALANYAGKLAGAADNQDASKAAIGDLGKTCKSCHTGYRLKKQ
ncbi:MAG: c-type cytochrome [Hyphomicrobiaceae bacterium]